MIVSLELSAHWVMIDLTANHVYRQGFLRFRSFYLGIGDL